MQYTVCLLTVTWLTGQPGVSPYAATTTAPPQMTSQPVPAGNDTQGSSPTLRERFRNLFRLHPQDSNSTAAAQTQPPPATTVWTSRSPGLGQQSPPTAGGPSVLKIEQAPMAGPAVTTVTSLRPTVELSVKDLERVGHEQDYSWITGRLFRVAGQAGRWGIRYAGQDEVDRFGGSLMLSSLADPGRFHEGDLVCVHGKVGTPGQGARPTPPVYEVQDISVMEPHQGR